MAGWPWCSVLRILVILATCFPLDSDAFLVSSAVGSVCDAGPGPLLFQRPFEEELCDATRDAAAVEATLPTGSGNREGGNPKPTTSPYLDPTRVASESTCTDSSRTCPPSLVSHSVGVPGSEADEEARGGSARLQGVPSSLESIQQGGAAGSLITNLGETDTVMAVATVEGTGVNPGLGEQRGDGRRTGEGKAVEVPSQESWSKQEPLLGAMTSAWHDEDTCNAHKEGDPEAGKAFCSSGGGENTALELQLLRTVDLEAGSRKRNTDDCCSKSLSCLVGDHCLLPVETGAQERGAELLEGVNTLGIDTDFGRAVEKTMEASSGIYDEGKGDSVSDSGCTTTELSPLRDDLVKPESGPHQQTPDLEGVSIDIPGPFISPAADVEAGNQQLIDGTNSMILDTSARDLEDMIQFTVSAIPETSASCNKVSSVAHQEGDSLVSSTGGREKLELLLEGGHTVELETKQDLHVFSGSLSRPERDVYLSSAVELDPGAQEPGVTVVEGDGSKVLGLKTDDVEYTASAIPEAAGSHDVVFCDSHNEGDPDTEKDVSSSIGEEVDDGIELQIDPLELSHSGSISSPMRDTEHIPTVKLEAGAEEQERVVVKGGVLDVDTDAGGRAVETIEFPVTESPEASSNTAKNAASSTLETPLEGEVELEAGTEKREVKGIESNTLGIDTDDVDVETMAEASASRKIDTFDGPQKKVPDVSGGNHVAVAKGDGRGIVGIAGDGDVLTRETELEENVLPDTTSFPWTQWAWGALLCVTLVASYAYTQGKLPRWLPFNGGDQYERWARDLDTAIATARSRAGSFCATAGRTSSADDLPDLVAEGETLTLSEGTQGACASDRRRSAVKQEVMWDTRPKSPDRLVFDPVLGVVPSGILDAWAHADRECGSSRNLGGDAGEVAATPDGLACCGNWTPLERREKKRRVLPPVRYTPEWHAWRKARADSVLAESAREESVRAESVRVESVDSEETESEKGTEGLCPRGGVDGVVEGPASIALALGKNGMPFVPKTWTPAAIDSQFEGVADVTGGATERGGEDEAGKFVEFSTESRDGDDSDARPSERCFAPVSTTSPKASPTPPAVRACL